MTVLYEFPVNRATEAGSVSMCGTCEILDVRHDQCAGTSMPYDTAMQIHMQSLNWGRTCNCPKAIVQGPNSACTRTAQMGVRPFIREG